ncbi:MAG: ABC-type metal ion transporter, periplasmic subunit [Candidatus Collierbacteria bacterium GW2011_GWC2_45_15]|uniref:ABC-type metal ion transporter, periplasmic subunit n=1 Tax=Candidatus Collierbacteria bacterium GW2011_GWC2_45_15 TaxID=1618394 RepID=A0A0G1LL65_9BACT|nr:MAG: ABC-type metal ion transporter, periplasmic subunit [Candidatus Collierbacteria bacterium GW2011_GWC2_45_15]
MKHLIKIGIFSLLLGLIVYFLILRQRTQNTVVDSNKLSVYTSIYPLTFFAQEIGGDKVLVTTITPPGVEPHEYDPNPGDLANIYKAELLILNGANMEPWADKAKADIESKGIHVVTSSDGIDLLRKDGQPDPHFWLDPVSAQRIVLNIMSGLIKTNPENESYFRANADKLIVKLIDLDNKFRQSLFNCKQNTVIASHSVFGYLESRYKFKQDTLAGLSPDEEPSSQRIAEIVATIKQKNIKYVLTETLLSPKLAETLSRETGVIVQVFNPLESLSQGDLDKGENYFTIQETNRQILVAALQCTTN